MVHELAISRRSGNRQNENKIGLAENGGGVIGLEGCVLCNNLGKFLCPVSSLKIRFKTS